MSERWGRIVVTRRTSSICLVGGSGPSIPDPDEVDQGRPGWGSRCNDVEVRWFGEKRFESVEIVLSGEEDCGDDDSYVDAVTGECVERNVSRRSVNLHKVWDLLILQRFIEQNDLKAEAGDSEFLHKAYASAVAATLRPEEVAEAVDASYWSWVEESIRLSAEAYDTGGEKLDEGYYDRAVGIVNRRIALAGHRLAATLNRLFGGAANPELESEHEELRRKIVALAGDESPLAELWPDRRQGRRRSDRRFDHRPGSDVASFEAVSEKQNGEALPLDPC